MGRDPRRLGDLTAAVIPWLEMISPTRDSRQLAASGAEAVDQLGRPPFAAPHPACAVSVSQISFAGVSLSRKAA